MDVLRGIAALIVVVFHLTNSTGLSAQAEAFGSYGYLGVEVFFVISGFVIPYSMVRRSYSVRDAWRFLAKRIARLDPPYFAAIALAIVLPSLTMGDGFVWPSLSQLLAHLGYASAVLGYEWISPVFWTLAIEFQFYLFISVAFGVVAAASDWVALMSLTVCALAPLFVPSEAFLPHWSGLFVIGALWFRHQSFGTSLVALAPVWGVATVVTMTVNGLPEAIAGLAAVVFIGGVQVSGGSRVSRIFLWLGTISYSLYLTHHVIGVTAVAVTRHLWLVGDFEAARVILGTGISLLAAWGFHHLFERPAMVWAVRISHAFRFSSAGALREESTS